MADEAMLISLLAGALAICILTTLSLCIRGRIERRRLQDAQDRLAQLAQRISDGWPAEWTETGVARVDAIGRDLLSFEQRLRNKREKLRELNEQILKGAAPLHSSALRALIDVMPVGVVLAEAPSGRILEGNRAIEDILQHPVIYSESGDLYQEWRGYYADGLPVRAGDYPLARALAGEERPTLECRYRRGGGDEIWINIVGAPVRNEKREVVGAIVAVMDIDQIKNAEAHRHEMNCELHHRVNNALAMIQGLANITARTARNLAEFRDDFSDRIQCLSRLSTLLVQNSWGRTAIADTVEAVIAHYARDDKGAQIVVEGDAVKLRSEVAVAIGMALCELLSNAEQFGALSQPEGRVHIAWRVEEGEKPRLSLSWAETGGPPVDAPSRTGAGLYLLRNVLARQLGGDVDIAFEPDGVRATLTAEI